VVRGTVEETLQALLEADADALCGARRYERSVGRLDTRAGHYERRIEELTHRLEQELPRKGKRRGQGLKKIKYFVKRADQMRYGEFRRQGFFVGSGVIEAGCKTLIGKRFKNSGMFWSRTGANAIIAARCCLYSGRFEDFWADIGS
jgi:hypothetical protein